jgi:hypothetical protein
MKTCLYKTSLSFLAILCVVTRVQSAETGRVTHTLNLPAEYAAGIYGGALPFGAGVTYVPATNTWDCTVRPTPIIGGTPSNPTLGGKPTSLVRVVYVSQSGNDSTGTGSRAAPYYSPYKASRDIATSGKSYGWIVLDDSVTYWDYTQYVFGATWTFPDLQITTLNGGPVKLTTAMFTNAVNTVTWTHDPGSPPVGTPGATFSAAIPASIGGTPIGGTNSGVQAVFDKKPSQLITQMTKAGRISSLTCYGWQTTQPALHTHPGSAYVNGTAVHVSTIDGRVPDGDIMVFLCGASRSIQWGFNSGTIDHNLYFKNVGIWGNGIHNAHGALLLRNASATNRWQCQFDTCDFSYTGGFPATSRLIAVNNLASVAGGNDIFCHNCISTSAWNDCFNAHLGGFGAKPYRLLYVNCIAVDGNLGRDQRNSRDGASNAYTIHDLNGAVCLINCYGDSVDEPLGNISGSLTLECGGAYAGYYSNTAQPRPTANVNNTAVKIGDFGEASTGTLAWLLGTTVLRNASFNISCVKAPSDAVHVWQPILNATQGNYLGYAPANYAPTFTEKSRTGN